MKLSYWDRRIQPPIQALITLLIASPLEAKSQPARTPIGSSRLTRIKTLVEMDPWEFWLGA